ncbi:enoyl-CoA hydratase/isomerase family protein [Alicyclobacillus dauci]|uniref:Enoyl-CoA hydratase-related protein n=1 Tax=Alicyclobacillus dauci TaxID=1475485 RepID=A0ABY6Z2I2_9BACL|nr:enoyl-CoA hydratase-related protein [Alicyclobacillus dauci]WAH36892.1 enoyl-CoA hydratase-related protein [Alicyclobacillus dauci]
MTEANLIQVNIDEQIAVLSLNRPAQRNALNRAVLSELGANIAMLSGRRDLRAVIIRGEGKAFAAGADISEMQAMTAQEAEQFARFGQRVFTALENLPQPTIALVHGFALGGGMELSMACDVRIAAEGGQFGQPEVTLGVLPGFGGSQRLPRIIGQGRALDMLLTGKRIDAQTALAYGLVSQVVSEDALLDAGIAYANQLKALGPVALGYVKRAVYDGAELDLSKGQAMEANLFGLTFATRDQKEGMNAFLAKRSAEFRGE